MPDDNPMPGELPNMPTGSVPEEIRSAAGLYVQQAMQIDNLSEELKVKKELLMTIMAREKNMVVAINVAGARFKLTYEPGQPRLKIKEIDKVKEEG